MPRVPLPIFVVLFFILNPCPMYVGNWLPHIENGQIDTQRREDVESDSISPISLFFTSLIYWRDQKFKRKFVFFSPKIFSEKNGTIALYYWKNNFQLFFAFNFTTIKTCNLLNKKWLSHLGITNVGRIFLFFFYKESCQWLMKFAKLFFKKKTLKIKEEVLTMALYRMHFLLQ